MENLKHLLVATDFSERAAKAETRAAMLCSELHCHSLELLNVQPAAIDPVLVFAMDHSNSDGAELIVHGAEHELEQKSMQLKEIHQVDAARNMRFGDPATEILARTEEIPADLTIIGAHGGNPLTDLFVGNTADKLVCNATRPLLIVKRKPDHRYESVLVTVDFSEDSVLAARMALKVAPAAHIVFLHAFTVPFEGYMHAGGIESDVIYQYRVKAAEEARCKLNRFIDELGPRTQLLSRTIAFGHPVAVISEAISSMKPQLIVLGKHGRSHVEEFVLGSVTRRIVDQAECDVLVTTAPWNPDVFDAAA
ncbi:MAG TPA: universal stress protein [Noviherbaspirillum sp.]|nr:universal stress protein [Noviherbaspirillum sp.]